MTAMRISWSLLFYIPTVFSWVSCSRGPRLTGDKTPIIFSKSEGISGDWDSLGIPRGAKVPDITLFSPEGELFHLYEELHRGKPVVIFNASYTCDVSRSNLPKMERIVRRFENKAKFYVVYTIEPHPADTLSPYSGDNKIWIADKNVLDTIAADQPRTYGERVELAKQWRDKYHFESEIVIDSPDNYYWETFGQAPNMAYVIEPDGTVFYKQSWFRDKEFEVELDLITAE